MYLYDHSNYSLCYAVMGGDSVSRCHGNKTASWRIEAGGGRFYLIKYIGRRGYCYVLKPGVKFPGGYISMAALVSTNCVTEA
jgi:hypothetical protein